MAIIRAGVPPVTEAIGRFLDSANQNWTAFLTAMTAIGFLSMAIIETLKNMLPIRNVFQRFSLESWLRQHGERALDRFSELPDFAKRNRAEFVAEAKRRLLTLSVNDNENALYDLPVEQMCGQMNAAIRLALDHPRMYLPLLAVAAAHASPDDMKLMLAKPPAAVNPETMTPDQIRDRSSLVDARNRVTHQTQRAIDAFQISTGYNWKLLLQIVSFAIPFLFVYWAGSKAHIGGGARLLASLAAGFIAPVAHDVVVIIQRLKRA